MAPNNDFEVEEDDEGNKYARMTVDQATSMREQARTAEANRVAAEAGTEAQRKLAFYEAGIDIKSDLGELFFNGYSGDVTPEAILAAAAKYPDLVTPAASAAAEPTAEELEAQRQEAAQTAERQNLARGAQGDIPAAEKSGKETANDVVKAQRDLGRRDEVAQGMGVAALATAALKGDKSVLLDPRSEPVAS